MRCRVTTISRNWTGDDNIHDLIAAFDQEAACVVMAQISGTSSYITIFNLN